MAYYNSATYAANTGTNAGNGGLGTAWLMQEYLVRTIGQEASQRSNMPEVCNVQRMIDFKTMSAHFRYLNPVEASAATEANALPVADFAPTGVVVSCAMEGLAFQASVLASTVDSELLDQIAQTGYRSLTRIVDKSALQLFPSFTGGAAGSGASGTYALTQNDVYAGIALLDTAHADEIGDYNGRISATQFEQLRKDIKAANSGIAFVSSDGTQKDTITISGATFKKNSYVVTANSATSYVGGLFVREAIGIAVPMDPIVLINYIPGYGAYSIDCMTAYGTSIVRGALGVTLTSGVNG